MKTYTRILAIIVILQLLVIVGIGGFAFKLWSDPPFNITYKQLVDEYGIGNEIVVLDSVQLKIRHTITEHVYHTTEIPVLEYVKVTETVYDTIPLLIQVPIYTKTIEDFIVKNEKDTLQYRLVISGHRPELDSIDILSYPHIYVPYQLIFQKKWSWKEFRRVLVEI